MIPGTTPAAPDDSGAPDAGLVVALEGGSAEDIGVALLRARLLVPVVALPGPGEAEMAVPNLVAEGGERALPVFSSYDALRSWRPDARPVPMPGARVFAAVADEGFDGVVLDVAGPRPFAVSGADLRTLAAAGAALLANPEAQVHGLPRC